MINFEIVSASGLMVIFFFRNMPTALQTLRLVRKSNIQILGNATLSDNRSKGNVSMCSLFYIYVEA